MVGSAVDLMLAGKTLVSVASAPIMPLAGNEQKTALMDLRANDACVVLVSGSFRIIL